MPTNPGDEPELATSHGPRDADPQTVLAKRAFAVIRTVLDPYAMRILLATNDREYSALDLSRALGLPIVACYRRIRVLEDLGVLGVSRSLTSSAGHPIRLFRSHLRSARITFEEGRLVATIELAPPDSTGEAAERLIEAFDAGPVRRKRSRAPRDLGYAGAALELVAHGRERALDPGEAGG